VGTIVNGNDVGLTVGLVGDSVGLTVGLVGDSVEEGDSVGNDVGEIEYSQLQAIELKTSIQ